MKVDLSGESSYSMSTTELHMSLRRNHPTSRQARNSPKFGSLFDQKVKIDSCFSNVTLDGNLEDTF